MIHERRLRRLRSQLVLTFLLSSLGIGFAIGLPVSVLINRQSSSQAQLLLDQATLTTQAFLAGEQADLQNLALLVSQRPTLTRLLQEQDAAALQSYLEVLRAGGELDLLVICADGEEFMGISADVDMQDLCQSATQTGYSAPASGTDLYLYTAADLESIAQPVYTAMVGKRLSLILSDLQTETGLLYFLMQDAQVLLTSDPAIRLTPTLIEILQTENASALNLSLNQRAILLNERRYLVGDMTLAPTENMILRNALNVDEQITSQQALTRTLILALFLIVLLAFGLGVWQAQRISRPIVDLADAAGKFRQGDLNAPVSVQSSVLEISQLANTLEDARVALQHSMEQLQAEKAWIEHLLNAIVEGTLTLDSQNRITFASAGVGKIIERDPEGLIGRHVDEVFPATEGEVAFSAQLPSPGQQRRVSVTLVKGHERLLSISKANLVPPVASDADRALVIRDVTNEEYIHRLLGDFMANITHEFRTPLAALEASSELLLDNLHTLSQSEIKELLVSLNLGIINLQTLIDNLIEAASIEAGRFKVSVQPVSFEDIQNEARSIMQPLIERYELRLRTLPVQSSVAVLADQKRTVQILVNLLSNAIKHSPANGLIQIEHTRLERALRITVTDEGSGIPAELRNQLFRRFSHLETPNNERARSGAGLGLSVVKAIVDAQQGEVGVTDSPNGGSSFWFTLPLVEGSSQ